MAWYEIVTIVISILTLLGFGTVMQLFWKDRHDKKKANTEEAKVLAKKERQQEIREVIKEQVEPISNKVDIIDTRSQATAEGTLAGLRNMLLNCYKDYSKKGYRTSQDIENWKKLIDAYHKLGGNSFINEIDAIIENIDTEEKYLARKKAKAKEIKKKKLLNE